MATVGGRHGQVGDSVPQVMYVWFIGSSFVWESGRRLCLAYSLQAFFCYGTYLKHT